MADARVVNLLPPKTRCQNIHFASGRRMPTGLCEATVTLVGPDGITPARSAFAFDVRSTYWPRERVDCGGEVLLLIFESLPTADIQLHRDNLTQVQRQSRRRAPRTRRPDRDQRTLQGGCLPARRESIGSPIMSRSLTMFSGQHLPDWMATVTQSTRD